MTTPDPKPPHWRELYQLMSRFGEEWTDEYAHEYDVAEDFRLCNDDAGRAALVADINAFLDGEAVYFRNTHVFPGAELQRFLTEVRDATAAGTPLVAPPGWFVPDGERRPEGGFPELRHLASYVSRYLRDDSDRAIWFDPTALELAPGPVAGYRLRELADLYRRRLVAECAEARRLDREGRFEAIGGDEHWDPEQDPNAWLDLVEAVARFYLDGTPLPEGLGGAD